MAYSPIPSFLTVERFETWLKQQPSSNIVGIPSDGTACPLATFINDQGEYAWVNAGSLFITIETMINDIDSTSAFYQTPVKLAQFVDAVDLCDDRVGITAAQALEILRKL